jgi:hypothetical protein
MKTAAPSLALLFICLSGNPSSVLAGGVHCPPPAVPCPTTTTVTAPASKVIVDLPPPQVMFSQSAAQGHRWHWHHRPAQRTGISTFVPMSAPAATFQPMSVLNVPTTSFTPTYFVPMTTASIAPAFAPQMSTFSMSAAPMQTMSVFQPMQTMNFAPSGGTCQSSISSDPGSLAELVALNLKAQELKLRANAVLSTAMKQNLDTQQLAISVLAADGKQPAQTGITAQQNQDVTAQMQQLAQQVERLTRIVEAMSVGKR